MRPSHPISCSILLSPVLGLSLAAAAQNAQSFGTASMGNVGEVTAVHTLPAVAGGCPVSMHARHGANASLQQADRNRPKGLAQLLHLTLIDPESRTIVRARVRVHGLSGKVRATQTLTDAIEADSARTVEVRFSPTQDKTATANLWVPAMTAVLKIDLYSVTYADGTTRDFSVNDGCRVAPDPLMLTSARQP
jgi:hypothetical protein